VNPARACNRLNEILQVFLDTIICSVTGQKHPAIRPLLSFTKQMGPMDGWSEYFFAHEKTSSAFAALGAVNGGSRHVVELDDLNNAEKK
jgi:2-methylcitrate dehydratase PrpD